MDAQCSRQHPRRRARPPKLLLQHKYGGADLPRRPARRPIAPRDRGLQLRHPRLLLVGHHREPPRARARTRRLAGEARQVRTGKGEDLHFCAFLQMVRRTYRGHHVALILDSDTSHTAQVSQRLAAKLGITLLWLPTRSPHLNPMDHLWRDVKQNVCANRQDTSIDALVARVLRHIQRLPPRSALRKAGILSRRFWLRSALSKHFRRPT